MGNDRICASGFACTEQMLLRTDSANGNQEELAD